MSLAPSSDNLASGAVLFAEPSATIAPTGATATQPRAAPASISASVPTAISTHIVDAIATPTAVLSLSGDVLRINGALERLTGWSHAAVGTGLTELVSVADRQAIDEALHDAALSSGPGSSPPIVQSRVRLVVGRHRSMMAVVSIGTLPVDEAASPSSEAFLCQFEPVEQLHALRGIIAQLTDYEDSSALLPAVLDAIASPPSRLDATLLKSVGGCHEILASTDPDVADLAHVLCQYAPWTTAHSLPTALAATALPPSVAKQLDNHGYRTFFQVALHPQRDGRPYRLIGFSELTPAECATAIERFGLAADLLRLVIARADKEQEMEHAATHDALTKVNNRHGLEQAVLTDADSVVGVIYVDLDRLKPINDRYGHPVGDVVLRSIAGRLCRATRQTDVVARIGGDEFTIILRRVDGIDISQAANRLAARIVDDLSTPIDIGGRLVKVSASVGVAVLDPNRRDRPPTIDELIDCADSAMYSAKRAGGATHRVVGC